MGRNNPTIPFERYADDIVLHCTTEAQALFLLRKINQRFRQCKLATHPEKTKIVYCKDDDRHGTYRHEHFDFLGFTFRPRRSKTRWGKYFINFSPAMSDTAMKSTREEIRHWHLSRKSDKSLQDLAQMFNAKIRGWITYYGAYYKSAMYSVFRQLNRCLVRWAQQKYRKHRHQRNATHWLRGIAQRQPALFAHWQLGVMP